MAFFLFVTPAHSRIYEEPNWSERHPIPITGRKNIYSIDDTDEWAEVVRKGRIHALVYPVEVTGMLVPYQALENFFESKPSNPIHRFFQKIAGKIAGFYSLQDMYSWVGVHEYPVDDSNEIPFPDGHRPSYPMGVSLIDTHDGLGLSFSCATCHSANLFGQKVLGLTNRLPKANDFFVLGTKAVKLMPKSLFKAISNADSGELNMYKRLRRNSRRVGATKPLNNSLDTSLAQVALSLAKRKRDSWASRSTVREKFPRSERLRHHRADSKPAPWWNVKYKNRFLLDGSVVSGNPIFTNFLWNEIGRGADLGEIDNWLYENQEKVQELTAAVFATEAPRATEFFDESHFDLAKAKRGQSIYIALCSRCHGTYKKAWERDDAQSLSTLDAIETTAVHYNENTLVIDVGTDLSRALGMQTLGPELNRLEISKNNNTLVRPQNGYVPPPLVGIWARWPYLHNNSIPSLCALLTRSEDRPKAYYFGESISKEEDFDFECNGYPSGEGTPRSWIDKKSVFSTQKESLSNSGHDLKIFLEKNGSEKLTRAEKLDLIHFLQTL